MNNLQIILYTPVATIVYLCILGVFLLVLSTLFDILTGIDFIRDYIQPYFQCLLLGKGC